MSDSTLIAGKPIIIRLKTGQDITTATVVRLLYKKPDGSVGFWNAVIEDGQVVRYDVPAGVTTEGIWEFRAYVQLPGSPITEGEGLSIRRKFINPLI
jgi:hypothetical protein